MSFRLYPGLVPSFVIFSLFSALSGCSVRHDSPPPGPRVEDETPGPSPFADLTASSGIQFTYRNGEEAGHFAIIESLGGGVALLDYDNDGRLDIFLPGGGRYDGKKVLGLPCRLFRNLGGSRFEDVTESIGLNAVNFPYSHGAAALDYDRDGWLDLFVTGYNRVVLLHNESAGNGRRFVDVTKKAGLNDSMWSTSAAAGDLDGDGYPEIYVCHYGDWGFDTNHPTDCTYDGKTRDVCQPARFKQLPDTLYRNNRDGTFTDVSARIRTSKNGRGIGVQFVDVNGDARPDIYVANDTDDNFLFVNRGKPGELALEEIGVFAGVARDDRGMANGSMGVDSSDYDHSGRASILVTNYENELPALYKNKSDSKLIKFLPDTTGSGLGAIGSRYVSWGVGLVDFDHDGWEDILIVNGHAIRFPTKIDRRLKPVLMSNRDGRFKQQANAGWPYLSEPHNARGMAVGDLDNDGKLDVVVSHLNEPVAVLRNIASTEGRHWIGLSLQGDKHADLVGARVVIETEHVRYTRFVKGGTSYASTSDPRLNFGLGNESRILGATVYWPSGKVQKVVGLEPGLYWVITEGVEKPSKAIVRP